MTCVNLVSNDSHWTQVTWAGAVPLAVILAVPHCRNPSSGGCEEMNTATPHDHMAALTHVPRSVHSEQAVKLRAPKLTVVCAVYARANFPENMSVERHTWWTHQGCGENILERWDSPEGTRRFFFVMHSVTDWTGWDHRRGNLQETKLVWFKWLTSVNPVSLDLSSPLYSDEWIDR